MALFVPGKKMKPGTAGLSMAEIRSRRHDARRSDDSLMALPKAPSTIQELLAERVQLYRSLHTAQNVQKRAVALTEGLEQRFSAERKSLKEEMDMLKHRETVLTEENKNYQNNWSDEIEKHKQTIEQIEELRKLLQEEESNHEQTKQNLQMALSEACCRSAELEKITDEKQQKIQAFESLVETLQNNNTDLQDEIEKHMEQISLLRSECMKIQGDLTTEQNTVAKAQDECKNWQRRFEDSQAESKTLRQKLDEQEAHAVMARRESDELRNQIVDLLKANKQKESRIQDLERVAKSHEKERMKGRVPTAQKGREITDKTFRVDSAQQDTVDKHNDSERINLKKRPSTSLGDNTERNNGSTKLLDSEFDFESYLVNTKRLSFSPTASPSGSSTFPLSDILIVSKESSSMSKSRDSRKHKAKRLSRESDTSSNVTLNKNKSFSFEPVHDVSTSDDRSPGERFGILVKRQLKSPTIVSENTPHTKHALETPTVLNKYGQIILV